MNLEENIPKITQIIVKKAIISNVSIWSIINIVVRTYNASKYELISNMIHEELWNIRNTLPFFIEKPRLK